MKAFCFVFKYDFYPTCNLFLEYDPRFSVARFQTIRDLRPDTLTFTGDTTLCSAPG